MTLKSWSDTRWESRVKGIEPLRSQAASVREALFELRDETSDPKVKSEVNLWQRR